MQFLPHSCKRLILNGENFTPFSGLTEEVGDEGEEEKECITYNISIDIHYGIKSNRYSINKMAFLTALSFHLGSTERSR